MNVRPILRRARRLALATVVGAAVVGSVALASSAQGQDPQGSRSGERMDPRQMIDQRMATMTETLKLDSAQQTKIRSMLADEIMAMEELRKNGGGQRGGGGGGRRGGRAGSRRGGGDAPPDSTASGSGGGGPSPEVRAIWERTNKQIEPVLNPQQLTTFRQMFEQGQQQRSPGDSASRQRH
ncbi:MAG TPA: hypothetical protein VF908_05470 [Gemmatimonadaceae bacterium]